MLVQETNDTKSLSSFLMDFQNLSKMCKCPPWSLKVEEPVKEVAPAVAVKKQPPVQENAAAVQPVKAAAVEVSGAHGQRLMKP